MTEQLEHPVSFPEENMPAPSPVCFFGKHVILDFFACDQSAINNKGKVNKFMKRVVELAGMRIINGPFTQFYNHPEDIQESGVSSLVCLAESHASFHSVQRSGLVCMDLFSCKDFDVQVIINEFVKTFKPANMHFTNLNRGKDYGHEKYENVTRVPDGDEDGP